MAKKDLDFILYPSGGQTTIFVGQIDSSTNRTYTGCNPRRDMGMVRTVFRKQEGDDAFVWKTAKSLLRFLIHYYQSMVPSR